MNFTKEQENLIKYALDLATKIESITDHGADFAHKILPLAGSIRRNVAVLRGEMEKPEYTSLGSFKWLQNQVDTVEDRLKSSVKGTQK